MAEIPPLVSAGDLDEFNGAPFSPGTVDAAVSQVRRIAGWHIAPRITQTVTLDHDGSSVVHLPSLLVTEVASVRDASGSSPRELTGWRWSADGMLSGSFPCGFRVLEVTFTHGFEACPEDLLPVLASRTQRRAMQESLGSRSVSYSAEGDRAFESTLDSYRLGPRP